MIKNSKGKSSTVHVTRRVSFKTTYLVYREASALSQPHKPKIV